MRGVPESRKAYPGNSGRPYHTAPRKSGTVLEYGKLAAAMQRMPWEKDGGRIMNTTRWRRLQHA